MRVARERDYSATIAVIVASSKLSAASVCQCVLYSGVLYGALLCLAKSMRRAIPAIWLYAAFGWSLPVSICMYLYSVRGIYARHYGDRRGGAARAVVLLNAMSAVAVVLGCGNAVWVWAVATQCH